MKPLWKVSIPHYDLYRYLRAHTAAGAVLAALKRMLRERPHLRGEVYFRKWTDNASEYATLVVPQPPEPLAPKDMFDDLAADGPDDMEDQ